jgi:hypothetical protein
MITGSLTLRLDIDGEPYHGEYGIKAMELEDLVKALNSMDLHHHLSLNDFLTQHLTHHDND